jgi:hypothetical protein
VPPNDEWAFPCLKLGAKARRARVFLWSRKGYRNESGLVIRPFAALAPAACGHPRLIGVIFQDSERRRIKTLRLYERVGRHSRFKKFVSCK